MEIPHLCVRLNANVTIKEALLYHVSFSYTMPEGCIVVSVWVGELLCGGSSLWLLWQPCCANTSVYFIFCTWTQITTSLNSYPCKQNTCWKDSVSACIYTCRPLSLPARVSGSVCRWTSTPVIHSTSLCTCHPILCVSLCVRARMCQVSVSRVDASRVIKAA